MNVCPPPCVWPSSSYYIGPWTFLRGICKAVGVWGEEGSSQRLVGCPWLNRGYGVRTGEFGVGLGSMGPGEVGWGGWGPRGIWARFYRCDRPSVFPIWCWRWECGNGCRWQRWIKWHKGWWHFIGFLGQHRPLCFLPTLGSCGHRSYHNPTGLFQ
jgi:hypothetical protein